MIRVSYERYETGNNQIPGKWTIARKDFPNSEEADRFILRIRDNVIVGNIWKSSI